MKTQICTGEGISGVQVSLNLFELQFVLELAKEIKKYKEQKKMRNKWLQDRDKAENRKDFEEQNPCPKWPEVPRQLLDLTMNLWVRVAKSIPNDLDMENVFDPSFVEEDIELE